MWRLEFPAIVALSAVAALTATIGDASGREARPARAVEVMAPREVGEPVMAVVSIKTQHVTFYDADGWMLRAPVSTGMKGRETPAGVFTILEKRADHRSNLYDDAEMPHMQRLTWNGIAMHGGVLPGRAASKGCVRLPYGFASDLFQRTQTGMRVIISPDDAAPVEISHAALLMPNAATAAATPERAERLAREAEEAAASAGEAKKAAKVAARAAAPLAASLRSLERRKASADADLAAAEKALAAAKTDKALARAGERKAKAAERSEDARTRLERARAEAQAKIDAAASTKEAARAASEKMSETAKAASEAKLDLEPVSIFISRATQKAYVRRNTRKPWPDGGEVYDATIEAAVEIRDPDRPIGTHVFTAMAPAGDGLRWSAVTIDDGDGAESALDRVTIPRDILDRIAPGARPRSSIIISDEPLSRETNYRTEFVAVLSNQPQGGFKTRRPTPPAAPPVVISSPWGGGGGFFGFGYLQDPPSNRKPVKARPNTRRTYTKQWWW
jgi:hypothetical protein